MVSREPPVWNSIVILIFFKTGIAGKTPFPIRKGFRYRKTFHRSPRDRALVRTQSAFRIFSLFIKHPPARIVAKILYHRIVKPQVAKIQGCVRERFPACERYPFYFYRRFNIV